MLTEAQVMFGRWCRHPGDPGGRRGRVGGGRREGKARGSFNLRHSPELTVISRGDVSAV